MEWGTVLLTVELGVKKFPLQMMFLFVRLFVCNDVIAHVLAFWN